MIVFSTPATTLTDHREKAGKIESTPTAHPGFVAELDRYNGFIRTATEEQNIHMGAQSNHFIEYGVNASAETDVFNPTVNFNAKVGFSSYWRVQAVIAALTSINRTSVEDTEDKLVGLGHKFGAGECVYFMLYCCARLRT